MSSSDDDAPLGRLNGVHSRNGGYCLACYRIQTHSLPTMSPSTAAWASSWKILHPVPIHSRPLTQSSADHLLLGATTKSKDIIPKSLDKALDKGNPSSNHAKPGISLRNGPVEEMDINDEAPKSNGFAGKRKSRSSVENKKSYREMASDSEEDKPLVRTQMHLR